MINNLFPQARHNAIVFHTLHYWPGFLQIDCSTGDLFAVWPSRLKDAVTIARVGLNGWVITRDGADYFLERSRMCLSASPSDVLWLCRYIRAIDAAKKELSE